MTYKEMFLAELTAEVKRSRRAIENMPDGDHADWKPHDKSMPFGYLAMLVVGMPSWIALIVNQDELDVAPVKPNHAPPPMTTRADFFAALEKGEADARKALEETTDAHLDTNWKLLAAGNVVAEMTRAEMIRDTFNHMAHHRGQMTVYLRLLGAPVPALYGPSADDKRYE
ncbi:MAG: damage-inducible protein DinB [Gemmatimonadaceae bacterium]|nr:damage-inducible protein DinB [Gemmatimonadaceae bacterium]